MKPAIAVVDHRRANPVRGLLPKPAVFSSTGWKDIHLAVYQQPKFAIAEHQHSLHAIALGISTAASHAAPG